MDSRPGDDARAGPTLAQGLPCRSATLGLRLHLFLRARYDAGWSNFYEKYPRRPDLNYMLAPYVAEHYTSDGRGVAGWFGKAHRPDGTPIGEPTPAWALGPRSAVKFEEAHGQGMDSPDGRRQRGI